MIPFLVWMIAAQPVERLLDRDLTVAQRNDACWQLRGDKSSDAIDALRKALGDMQVQSCAGAALSAAGAVDVLHEAMASADARVRAIAARELGTLHLPESLPILEKVAHDPDPLVDGAAVQALIAYPVSMSRESLLSLARSGGPIGLQALHAAVRPNDPEALPIARQLMKSSDVADILAAIELLSECGERTDLPTLRALAKQTAQNSSYAPGRGFGLLPAVNISSVAAGAVAGIEARLR